MYSIWILFLRANSCLKSNFLWGKEPEVLECFLNIEWSHPGPKYHEISLMILHQIFQKSTKDPQVKGWAYRGCDLTKIPTRFLLKFLGISERDYLEILEWSSIKILLRPSADLKKILNEDVHAIFFRNLIEISWRF